MRGGSLDYVYSRIQDASDEITLTLAKQGRLDEWGYTYPVYSDAVQEELRKIAYHLHLASKFAKEAERFFSGDTGPDTFMK